MILLLRHIVYCIPNVTEMIEEQTLHHVILIEGLSVAWYLMYECLTNAARINLQVSLEKTITTLHKQ